MGQHRTYIFASPVLLAAVTYPSTSSFAGNFPRFPCGYFLSTALGPATPPNLFVADLVS